MDTIYNSHGVRFRYPAEWELTEQDDGEQISITVTGPPPHAAFWTLTLFPRGPDPSDLVAAAVDAFHEEYDELDDYSSKVRLCKRPTVARDVDFVCLELLNSAGIRAFRAPDFTVFVLYQFTEAERQDAGPILEQITRSLSCRTEASAEEAPDEENDDSDDD